MSIYIGKTPISSAWSSVSATASNSSTSFVLGSDNKENFIQFQNFRLGQYIENNLSSFQLYHSNVLLTSYNSNILQHNPNAYFLQNVMVESDLNNSGNLTTRSVSTCNVSIHMKSGTPLRINCNSETIFQIGLDGDMYFAGNLGIGITNPVYKLQIADSMRVQNDLIIKKTLDTSKLQTNAIYTSDITSSRIEFNQNNIQLTSTESIINNPSLFGIITYGATINLDQTAINNLVASNLSIINNSANQQAVYIQQFNPGGFANTATGNPLHIESYISSSDTNIPIFVVDALGRISSGKTTASIPDPDYGYSYYIDKDRYPYLTGFLQYTSCNEMETMIINKKGYISIGSNQTNYPLQIVNPYTGYESTVPRIDSLIGLYQTGSNQYAYLQCFDCNQNIIFQITNTGKLLFQQDPQFDASYQLEIQKRAYIRRLDTSNIFSTTNINFLNSSLSNINHIETSKLYAQSGFMSNVFCHNLTVENIVFDAFDYVSKDPNYEEFRIRPERFLFHGYNFVMNPNPYFFETEQPELSKDNVRIYANGGPLQSINVIRTIGNNQQSQVRIYNCNVAVNSISRALFIAKNEAYTFGVINLSTTPNEISEGFITNNGDLTDRIRQLSIHSEGIRVGDSIHFLKDGITTIGYKTPGKRALTVLGEAEFKNSTGQTALFIKNNGNIGIGTDTPSVGLDFKSQTVYISANVGIGKLNPDYQLDVNGIVRAKRILGVFFDDVIGGSFSNVTPWLTSSRTSNIYYMTGNVGIGTDKPIVLFHLHSSNTYNQKHIEVNHINYLVSWPPISSTFSQIVTSNIVAGQSNIIAPFMPRYPPNYLTSNITVISNALYGNGIYTVKSSSADSGYDAYKAFDNNANSYWISDGITSNSYNSSNGIYQGSNVLNGISGEWIQLFTSNAFTPISYRISFPAQITSGINIPSGYDVVSPQAWTLLGSNTSIGNWITLDSQEVYHSNDNPRVTSISSYSNYNYNIMGNSYNSTRNASQLSSISPMVIANNGDLYIWGSNLYGQLNISSSNSTIVQTIPTRNNNGSLSGKKIVAISGNQYTSAALDDNGALHMWGNNQYGQLGIGTYVGQTGVPSGGIATACNISSYGSLSGRKIIGVSCSDISTLALDSSGQVHAWGFNIAGMLGFGSNLPNFVSVACNISSYGSLKNKTIVAIGSMALVTRAAGITSPRYMALDNTGQVHMWGYNPLGFLGFNNSVPPFLTTACNISSYGSLNGTTITNIACGLLHSIALDSTGQVHTWGYNIYGQLGTGSTIDATRACNISSYGSLNGKTIVAVNAGYLSSYALDSLGQVHGWGFNGYGQLGNGTITNQLLPINISSYGSLYGQNITNILLPYGTIVESSLPIGGVIALDNRGNIHTWGQAYNGINSNVSSNLLPGIVPTFFRCNIDYAYTRSINLNTTSNYDVYAIVVPKANICTDSYGMIGISELEFYEASNQRMISVSPYNQNVLVGNTSNITTISSSDFIYNSGIYKVSMTSNYTQGSHVSFNTSSIPYTFSITSNIPQSDLSGILNANSSGIFTTLSNAFIITTDTNPPLSLQLTYPTVSTPIFSYSITGPSIINYAPRKWNVLASSDGTSWSQIDTRDSITWATNETKTFTFAIPSTYSQYRYDFYRNNSSNYAPLSLKTILSYSELYTTIPSLSYTTLSSINLAYNQAPLSNLSQLNIIGGVTIGSNSMTLNITPPNDSIIIDGALGIGTTLPVKPLHVQGDSKITGNMSNEGRLYIGNNSGGSIGGGIYFGGTTSDENYDHTVIENRTYVVTEIQKSELLFFKGNDTGSTSNGPDRIRLKAGEIRFDVYPTDTIDRYTECNVVIIDSLGTMTVNETLYTSNLATTILKSRNSGGNAFYKYTYLETGSYTLPKIPEIGCSHARIQMWGGGGGGAGGNVQLTINSGGTTLGGGGGGGGGAYGEIILPSELLSNVTLTATIGNGGAPGTLGQIINSTITATSNSTDATDGSAGTATSLTLTTNGPSTFSYTWSVAGGQGGSTSTTTSAGNLGAGGYPINTVNFTISQKGGDGGIGGTTVTGGSDGGILVGNGYAATGGGGGAGSPDTYTSTALYYSGGNSGSASRIESYLIGNTAFAYGSKYTSSGTEIQYGQKGYSILEIYTGGTGGGGSYGITGNIDASYYGSGNVGCAGGIPGGGGGGGASARTIVPDNTSIATVYGSYGGYGAQGGLILTYY